MQSFLGLEVTRRLLHQFQPSLKLLRDGIYRPLDLLLFVETPGRAINRALSVSGQSAGDIEAHSLFALAPYKNGTGSDSGPQHTVD